MIDLSAYEAEYILSKKMEWNKWLDKIPTIQFPVEWRIQLIPPFHGAIVRFRAFSADGEQSVSVYLDCYERLGSFGGKPYWEIYPYDEDVYRIDMNDTEQLIDRIRESFRQQKANP